MKFEGNELHALLRGLANLIVYLHDGEKTCRTVTVICKFISIYMGTLAQFWEVVYSDHYTVS